MKNLRNKMMTVMLAVLVCIMILPIKAQAAEAVDKAGKKPAFEKNKITLFLGDGYSNMISILNTKQNAVVSDVKVSDKSVLSASSGISVKGVHTIYVTTYKMGKSVISCTVSQGNKKYNIKCTVTVKHASPFKYIKIDGKNVYDKDGTHPSYTYKASKKNVKINFKLNNGWKVKKLFYNYHKSGSMTKDKSFKNNGIIKVKGPKEGYTHTSAKIDVKNGSGEVYRFLIMINSK